MVKAGKNSPFHLQLIAGILANFISFFHKWGRKVECVLHSGHGLAPINQGDRGTPANAFSSCPNERAPFRRGRSDSVQTIFGTSGIANARCIHLLRKIINAPENYLVAGIPSFLVVPGLGVSGSPVGQLGGRHPCENDTPFFGQLGTWSGLRRVTSWDTGPAKHEGNNCQKKIVTGRRKK